jgi:hypothetical protein
MEPYNFSPKLTNFVSKHSALLKNAELISVLIFAIGIILHFMAVINANIVVEIGSILTAITYWFHAFKLVEIENNGIPGNLNSSTVIRFIYKMTYLAYFLLYIATATQILKSHLSETLLFVTGATLIFVLTISLLTKGIDRNKIYNSSYYLRLILALMLLIILFYFNFSKHFW